MNRISKIAVLAIGLLGCTIGALVGVSDLNGSKAIGALSLSDKDEPGRAYVGTFTSGTNSDPQIKVNVIDTGTGAVLPSFIPGSSGGSKVRAISTDPSNNTVWTIREDAGADQWSQDLTTIISSKPAGFFNRGAQGYPSWVLMRICDFEVLKDGCFAVTEIYRHPADIERTSVVLGVCSYLGTPVAESDGFHVPIDVDPTWSCGRISRDPNDANGMRVASLQQYGENVTTALVEFKTLVRTTHGTTHGVTWVNSSSFSILKGAPGIQMDVAGSSGYGWLVAEAGNAMSGPKLKAYNMSGTLLTMKTFTELKAIDVTDWLTPNSAFTWWLGSDLASGKELGTVLVTDP